MTSRARFFLLGAAFPEPRGLASRRVTRPRRQSAQWPCSATNPDSRRENYVRVVRTWVPLRGRHLSFQHVYQASCNRS